MLDPRRLRVLREVAARGSFSAAAAALAFTQSAVSQQVAALERETGTPLVAGGGPVDLAALAGATWIGGSRDGAYHAIVLHGCRAAGFEPRVAFGSDDYNAVQAFVAVGLGIALLPRLALLVPRPGLRRLALTDPPVRRILPP